MKKIFKTMLLLGAVTTGMGTFVSCSSDNDLPQADALFRPIINDDDNLEVGLDDNNVPYMVVKWDNYTSANQYTVKAVPVDASVPAKEITTSELTCRFEGLEYDKEYFVYISSANTNTGLKSKEYNITTTTPDFPTKLINPAATDIIDIKARIKWAEGVSYDKLVIIKDSEDEIVAEVAVSEEENAACEKIIGGLEPKTTYRVEAWANGSYQGKKRLTTAAADNFEGTIIDLRGLDEETSLAYFENNLTNLIDVEYPNQDITIILEGGMTYRLKATKLNSTTGTIKFVTGQSLAGYAILNVVSNFDTNADAVIGGLVFDKINVWGSEPSATDGNFGGQYLFNIAGKNSKIGLIEFDNCDIKWKRGLLRQKDNASTVENFVMQNCTVDSIAGYGVCNSDKAGAVVSNIKISNSTFSTCKVLFVNTKGAAPTSIVVENCTFVKCPDNGKFVFDFKGKAPSGDFKISKCIFGPGLKKLSMWSGDVKPDATDIYYTSDVEWTPVSDEDPSPAAKLDGTIISTNLAETFKDWANGDFTILNTKELKNVGDPRWLP